MPFFSGTSSKFYDDTAQSIERRRRMAQAVVEGGKQPDKTEVVTGYAVRQTPLAGLARALQQGVGGVISGQADYSEKQKQENARKTMAEALGAFSRSQSGGTTALPGGETIQWNKTPIDQASSMYQNILMSNPDTAPIAMQGAMDDVQYQRRFPMELELARQKAAIEAQYRAPPASVQEWQFAQNHPEFKTYLETTGGGSNSKIWADAQSLVAASQAAGRPMDLLTAYGIAKSGLGVGRTMDNSGIVTPMAGALNTTGQFKFSETYGGKQGELQAEGEAGLPKATAAYNSASQKLQNTVATVDKILPEVNNATAGTGGAATAWIPGTAAYDLKSNIDTLLANTAFGELQEMRNNSPTGGALGGVAIRELELLSATKANVAASQSPGQLKDNLGAFRQQMLESQQRIKAAYDADVARFGQAAMAGVNPNIGPQGQGSNPALVQPYNEIQPQIRSPAMSQGDPERQLAEQAIQSGADPNVVRQMYQQRTGQIW